jgi:hypothetical protein
MIKKSSLIKWINLWPPMLGAGIRVRRVSDDFRSIEVEMKLRFWNKNYVGTQFGGTLYAMVDPFYMFMLIENLGPDYVVWDKAATIRFKKPGKGTVRARFDLTAERLAEIKAQADFQPKVEPSFNVQILDEAGAVIAEVEKILYVKKK